MGTTIMDMFYNNEGSYKISSENPKSKENQQSYGKVDYGVTGYDVMQQQPTSNIPQGLNTNNNTTNPNQFVSASDNNTSSSVMTKNNSNNVFSQKMQGGGYGALASTGDAIFSSITKKYEDKWAPKADADGIITDDRKNYQKGAMLGYAKGSSKGASLGTQIMPGWGTLIGAAVGGTAGVIMGDSQLKKETREIESHNQNVRFDTAIKNMNEIRTSYEQKKQKEKQQKLNRFPGQNNKYAIENGMMYQNNENGMIPLQY